MDWNRNSFMDLSQRIKPQPKVGKHENSYSIMSQTKSTKSLNMLKNGKTNVGTREWEYEFMTVNLRGPNHIVTVNINKLAGT